MLRQLPAPGDYTAKCTGQLTVILEKSGSVGVAVPYRLTNSDVSFSDDFIVYIVGKDGNPLQSGVDNLKKVFNWDGEDPWALMWEDSAAGTGARTFPDTEFKLADCKHEDYEKDGETRTSFKPSWLNPIGGGRQFTPANRADFMKSFGSKFRAMAGSSKPATKTAPAKTGAPAKPAAPAKKKCTAAPCTADDAFAELIAISKLDPQKEEDELSRQFFAKIAELFPDVPEDKQDKLTKEQYGELKAAFAA